MGNKYEVRVYVNVRTHEKHIYIYRMHEKEEESYYADVSCELQVMLVMINYTLVEIKTYIL